QDGQRQEDRSGNGGDYIPRSSDLLVEHEAPEYGHPPQVRHAGSEHDEHERPAASEAEHPVPPSQAERPGNPSSVVLEEERARMPALRQAAFLEAGELERPGEGQGPSADDPGV